ncbi:MAG: hypothetical protein KatS3mg031_2961 [Chitinophagales bacterium]|nr:MAG: hypothetical protein KatS3mg031_2961 [Chitinophagales bacterium]
MNANKAIKNEIIALLAKKKLTRKQLLAMLKMKFDVEDRTMRRLIVELIEEGYCIASSGTGYELIRTPERLNETVRYINSYIIDMRHRIETLKRNFENQQQLKLF